MIRGSQGFGRYVAGEEDFVFGTVRSWLGEQPLGIIFCRGSNTPAANGARDCGPMMNALGRIATMHTGDLGGNTFGNSLLITRVNQAIDYLHDQWGQEGPVVMVGASMGFCSAANYALLYPENVIALAGIIPLTDIQDAYTRNAASRPDIDAAYPPTYDDAVDGPAHSPVRFALDLPEDLPIHLWSSTNDPLTPASTAQAFVDVRPQTGLTSLGALGHTPAAINAAAPMVQTWLSQNLRRP